MTCLDRMIGIMGWMTRKSVRGSLEGGFGGLEKGVRWFERECWC